MVTKNEPRKAADKPRTSRGRAAAGAAAPHASGNDPAGVERLERMAANVAEDARTAREDRRAVETIARELVADDGTPFVLSRAPLPGPADSGPPTAEELTLEQWQARLEQLEPEGGVYVRVSRRGELSRDLTWICNLEDPQGPIEEQIERTAQSKGVNGPDVLFMLQPVSRKTRHYLPNAYHLKLAIAPGPPPAATAASAASVPVDPIKAAEAMLEAGKRLTPPPPTTPPVDPIEMLSKTMAMLKSAGVGDSAIEKLVPFIPSVVALAQKFQPAPPPDPFELLVKLRNAGILPDVREERGGDEPETAVDRFKELGTIVELLGPMLGVGRAEGSTVGVELVKVLPRALEIAAGPINNGINFARERMYYYGGAPPRRAARAPAPAPEPAGAIPEAGTPAAELVAVLEQAAPWAEANDERRFPALLAALCARVAGCAGMLNELQGGRIDEDGAYGMLGQLGVEVVEPLAGYLRRFLGWVRAGAGASPAAAPPAAAAPPTAAAPAPAAAPPSTAIVSPATVIDAPVIGRCNRCGAEYNYPSLAVLKSEQDPCDMALKGGRCNGRILPIGEGR